MADFVRKTIDFICRGINWSRPVDKLAPDEYRYLKNVRPYGENQIWARQGLTKESLNTLTDPIHTIKRMNDPVPSPTAFPGTNHTALRLYGASTNLFESLYSAGAFQATGAALDTAFSGNPLSVCVFKPDRSPRPWAWVADSAKMRKVDSSGQKFQVGIAPPLRPPLVTIQGPLADGPDIGSSGLPYLYRFVARTSTERNTGCTSAPGPPVRDENGLRPGGSDPTDPPASYIRITVGNPHLDPQVLLLDIYRFGGSLPEWIWIGSVTNTAVSTFDDRNSDADIAANPRLEDTARDIHYQPWVTVDQHRKGRCTVGAASYVNQTSGDLFKYYQYNTETPYYLAGSQIIVGGIYCTLYNTPAADSALEVVEDISSLIGVGEVDWEMPAPEMARTSLPFLWGPFGSGETGTFYFACGDTLAPGTLYWCKGNDPESHPSANSLNITNPTERLQNGCMYDGRSYVFSTERMYAIYPSFGQVSDFIAIEVPGSRGLFSRWAICSDGPAIFYRSRDGIFASVGQASACISEDIALIFGKESADSMPNILDGIDGLTVALPDPDEETKERLSFADGYLYYDFKATNGSYYTLVYDADPKSHGRGNTAPGWVSLDLHTPQVTLHYQEEGSNVHTILMGSSDGEIYKYGGYSDDSVAVAGQVRTLSFNGGDPRARNHWGDVWLDFDSDCDQITWKIGFDNHTFFSDPVTTALNITGRQQDIGDINTGSGQYASNAGLDITWSVTAGQPKLFCWQPAWLEKPELTGKRVTDWTDCGHAGEKTFQGILITADTLGEDRTVTIQSDGAVVSATLAVNHLGEEKKPYSFPLLFNSHKVRILPTDENFWRLLSVDWVFEPMPELTEYWITQSTTLDFDSWFYHRAARIALISTGNVTMTVRVGGTSYVYTIPSTAGVPEKPYVSLEPMKGKVVEYYSLTAASPGFRLFQKDCSVLVKQWGSTGPFIAKNPFGGPHRESGARI